MNEYITSLYCYQTNLSSVFNLTICYFRGSGSLGTAAVEGCRGFGFIFSNSILDELLQNKREVIISGLGAVLNDNSIKVKPLMYDRKYISLRSYRNGF